MDSASQGTRTADGQGLCRIPTLRESRLGPSVPLSLCQTNPLFLFLDLKAPVGLAVCAVAPLLGAL